MTQFKVVQQRSPGYILLRFLAIGTFRFFLGRPLNGKKIDNSTFLRGATKGRPGKKLTKWQKKPHFHRALIRSAVFWPIVSLLIGLIIDRGDALFALALSSPIIAYVAVRRSRLIFMQPYTSTDAATGRKTQHWHLRPKYRRLFHRQVEPGLLTKKNAIDDTLPPAVQEALRAEINSHQYRGEMPAQTIKRVTRGKGRRREIQNG